MEEACAATVADAKARAVSYAKLLGASLGTVVFLQENSVASQCLVLQRLQMVQHQRLIWARKT
jgi:uncharacterized protein YggE